MSFIIPPPFRIDLPEQLLLSDSITGVRSGVAASEKALGLVNKRIPQARLAQNGQGPIAYGSIRSGTGEMIQFTTSPRQWGIISLSLKTSTDSSQGYQNIFSLGLMSLSDSQRNITDRSAVMTLLMDSSVTRLYSFGFNEDNAHERFMTLLIDSSISRIVFFDCPFGMSVTLMQELVIK